MKTNRIIITLLLVLFAATAIFAGSKNVSEEVEEQVIKEEKKKEAQVQPSGQFFSDAVNEFGVNLFCELNKGNEDQNIVISPLSISMALSMAMNGADGQTLEEMKTVLGYGLTQDDVINESAAEYMKSNMGDKKVQFNIANAIWYKESYPFYQEYIGLCNKMYNAEIFPSDFQPELKDEVNGWVSEKTEEKIKEILDQVNSLDRMFLVNAIYFFGNWTDAFAEEKTKDDIFYLGNGSEYGCQMMNKTTDYRYMENEMFQAVGIPYGEGYSKYSMCVFLPKEDKTPVDVLEYFKKYKFGHVAAGLTFNNVALSFPKFKIEYGQEVQRVLPQLGMKEAFGMNADFSRMAEGKYLYIARVIHKTFIKVDEKGTEAAAATVVAMRLKASQGDAIEMRVNRPFIFAITENKTNNLIFLGKVALPEVGADE